jgi:SAM-dependent methyltransferase
VDLVDELILWCQQHLSPPFKFATVTSFPHLPFADDYFDLVYGYSVFTHIADLSDAWLLELGRIVRPGGRLFLTVHDEHTIDLVTTPGTEIAAGEGSQGLARELRQVEAQYPNLRANFAKIAIHRAPGPGGPGQAQIYYHADYLRNHWGNYFDVLSVTREVFGFQTAVLLGKPS